MLCFISSSTGYYSYYAFHNFFTGGQFGIQIGSQFSGGLLRNQNGTFIYTVYLYLFATSILNNKNCLKEILLSVVADEKKCVLTSLSL